jgi:hypothetical protein
MRSRFFIYRRQSRPGGSVYEGNEKDWLREPPVPDDQNTEFTAPALDPISPEEGRLDSGKTGTDRLTALWSWLVSPTRLCKNPVVLKKCGQMLKRALSS